MAQIGDVKTVVVECRECFGSGETSSFGRDNQLVYKKCSHCDGAKKVREKLTLVACTHRAGATPSKPRKCMSCGFTIDWGRKFMSQDSDIIVHGFMWEIESLKLRIPATENGGIDAKYL